ncbi:sugar-binding domain-containing protein [Spirosoma sp. SC4-14]|uniref:sugar-binding domain-containing protein n=1 Tax=Spirosoma sp. SC4-14 TaxID=3128900 RepID=UPI0030CF0E20
MQPLMTNSRNYKLLTIALLVVGLASSTLAQKTTLDGTWSFRTDPNNEGEQQGWFRPQTATANWDSLPVPGNWDLRNEYAHYVGKGWYRRTFTIPDPGNTHVVRLLFEAVYHDCSVWLNGQKLGENHSGFLPFEFDVTKRLNTNGQNTLVVCADNSLTRGATWNWGGIRRPVSLIISEPVRVVRQHITPSVDLTKKTATVAVRVFLQNHSSQPAEATGTVQLTATNGFTRSLPFNVSIPASTTASALVQTTLTPKETHLWHFDDPFLYTATTSLANGETQRNRFGLRKIEIDNKAYTLKLNGEVIRPMGFNLVPDDRTTGNTLPTWRIKEDIDLLKGLGCTMTRLSHLCLPEEVMDYLDERGMLIISEIPLWGFDRFADPNSATSRNWLTRLITNQYNHPSVIMWSVGNEIGYFPKSLPYVEKAIPYARTVDSTRYLSVVSHTGRFSPDIVDAGDMGLVNGYSQNLASNTRQIHEKHPDKTLFYTEYGIGQMVENLDGNLNAHLLVDSIRNFPYLIGASLWTFNDYRSRFNGTKEGSENRPWGVVDVYRRKKRAYQSIRKEYSPVRELALQLASSSATVMLTPRGALDLPAFPLHGYRLLWKRTDATGKIEQGGLLALPDIRPGDATKTYTVNWQPDNAFAMSIELLSATGDVMTDTTLFLQKPKPAVITYTNGGRTYYNGTSGGGVIRVHFQKNPTATAYKARYGESTLNQETPTTSNDYIDIPKLTLGKTYQVAIVDVNNAGETQSPDVRRIKVDTTQYAPPVIQHIEPADGGFYVGYASPETDYLYRIQVTTQPGNYANARTVQTTDPGTLFVPNLTNGQSYFFRFQRVTDSWSDSDWSEERNVTPDGGQRPVAPVLQGIVRAGRDAVICFEPVAKATGYVLQYQPAGSTAWQQQPISTAQTGRFILTGLDIKKTYQYRLATLNQAGQSTYSASLTVQPNDKVQRNR